MSERWAPAIKSALGDVWHVIRNGHARCDKRLRVDEGVAQDVAPRDRYVCKRCAALVALPDRSGLPQ